MAEPPPIGPYLNQTFSLPRTFSHPLPFRTRSRMIVGLLFSRRMRRTKGVCSLRKIGEICVNKSTIHPPP